MANANSHIARLVLLLVVACCFYIPTQQMHSCEKETDCTLLCPGGGHCDASSHLCICKPREKGNQLFDIPTRETMESANGRQAVTKKPCKRDIDCYFQCPKGGFCNNKGFCDCLP